MAEKEKISSIHENVNKRDLELILEVNKKAIEIETEVADQNEEVISLLSDIKNAMERLDEKHDKIIENSEQTNKDLFKIQVLFIAGLLNIIVQLIQMFKK